MASVFVVGAASLDTLHIKDQIHSAAGGAGLYTALAARFAGAEATLCSPKSEPMPEALQPIAERIQWIGPIVAPSQLSRLEIAHHGNGKATLLHASWGAVAQMAIDILPNDLSHYDVVHIAALPSAQMQVAFLRACRLRNASIISAGTYARVIADDPDAVRTLLVESDLFFMNENEADELFGAIDQTEIHAGPTIFVTRDRDGALIYRQNKRIAISGNPVDEIDPTGAGDTFCGAVLAYMALGLDLAEAAKNGCRLAASTVQGIGPSRLLMDMA